MKKSLILLGVLSMATAYAQEGRVGINTENPNATLEVAGVPTNRRVLDGIIAPRITGDQLKAKTYTANQTGALVYVTEPATTANQTGQTINVAGAGYYYFDGSVWQIFKAGDTDTNNLYTAGTGIAISNDNVISRTGLEKIGTGYRFVGTDVVVGNYAIDMNTMISEGSGATGQAAVTMGSVNIASGESSLAMGYNNKATKAYGVALGNSNTASGIGSVALGNSNTASGNYTTISGNNNKAIGTGSTVFGSENIANSNYSLAVGRNHTISTSVNSVAVGLDNTLTSSPYTSIMGRNSTANTSQNSILAGDNNHTYRSFTTTFGVGNITKNISETVLGRFNFNTDEGNTDLDIDNTAYLRYTDPNVETSRRQLFTLGNGGTNNSRTNAIIVLRSAYTGIGLVSDTTTPANSKPTEMLDVNGNVRVRGAGGTITEGATCTNAGTISFGKDGNFYGCAGTTTLTWKKLHN